MTPGSRGTKTLIAALALALAGCPQPVPEPDPEPTPDDGVLFSDDFDDGLTHWIDWNDSPGWIQPQDGALVIETPAADHDEPAFDGDETFTYGALAAYCPALDEDGLCLDPTEGWGTFALEVDVNVRRQVRQAGPDGSNMPAAWEVGWLLFRFQDTRHYYFVLFKTHHLRDPDQDYGGVEIGKYNCLDDCGVFGEDSGKETLFEISAAESPGATFDYVELDRWYSYRVELEDADDTVHIRLWIDGEFVGEIADDGTLEALWGGDGATPPLRRGGLGLYAEDSETWFDDLTVTRL